MPGYRRDSTVQLGRSAPLPLTFASLSNTMRTLAFSTEGMFSLLLAFGGVSFGLPFLIESDGLTFF